MTDTLKSICEQCSHLHNPQLEFIPTRFPRYREIISRDLSELVSAASTDLEKTVVILAGSILEAVLYSFILGQEAYIAFLRGQFTFNPKHGLENYMRIFNRYFRDDFPGVMLRDTLIDYRDLVHFNREIESPPDICVRGSQEMLRTLNALLGELSQHGGPRMQNN